MADRTTRPTAEQNRTAQRMTRIIINSSFSDSDTTDDDAPPAANAYVEDNRRSRDPKGKRPARKW